MNNNENFENNRINNINQQNMNELNKTVNMNNKKKHSPMVIAALTLGIISICTVAFWYISIPSSIIAIVFGSKTTKRIGSKLGKAGLVTGIIGLSLTLLLYIVVITIIALGDYF